MKPFGGTGGKTTKIFVFNDFRLPEFGAIVLVAPETGQSHHISLLCSSPHIAPASGILVHYAD